MFRKKNPQRSLFEVSNLLPAGKLGRLERTWAKVFADKALPLIDEDAFKDLYCADNGRPNKAVQTVVGVLILKDMFDHTDNEAVDALEFDLRWQAALRLTPDEAHCCQKTLHNFRVALVAHDRGRLLFESMTDRILTELGIDVGRQRLDSTHIVSNIARLSRLGLFCETIRVVLRDLRRNAPDQFASLSESLRRRHLKDDGTDTAYHDARSTEAKRRLDVAARDLWRLCDRFRGDDGRPESLARAERLLAEQCEIATAPVAPAAGDADAGDSAAPVTVKASKAVAPDSLQSPHDPDATYGHKGKGYEVQVCETFGNGDKPELITYVNVTPSSGSDAAQVIPTMAGLTDRGLKPTVLLADTTFASTENVMDCAERGTELLGPTGGRKSAKADAAPTSEGVATKTAEPVRPASNDADASPPAVAGPSPAEAPDSAIAANEPAPASNEPANTAASEPAPGGPSPGARAKIDKQSHRAVLDERRRYEETDEFRKRYAQRAGIEATNSELKRAHGLGKLRVRGGARVKLSVFFKSLACNVKRMVTHMVEVARKAVRAALSAVDEALREADEALREAVAALAALDRPCGTVFGERRAAA